MTWSVPRIDAVQGSPLTAAEFEQTSRNFLRGRNMGLTYADREMIQQAFDRLQPRGKSDDRQLLEDISLWAEQLHPSVGFENTLLRDITVLCRYLTTLQAEDLKELARGALRYCLLADDLIPDDTPIFGLQDDAYVVGFAVHEIRTRLGEPAAYSPPKLTPAEESVARKLFEGFRQQPLCGDDELFTKAEAFCDAISCFSGSGFFGRLGRNVHYLMGILSDPHATNFQVDIARAALSYLHCRDDAIDDSLGLIGYLDDNFVIQTAVDLVEPGRDPWLNLLDSVAEQWPFINRVVFNEAGAAYPLSEFLIINAALSCSQLRVQDGAAVTALVLPFSGPMPVMLGFLAAVGLVQESVRSNLSSLSFQPGQRVIVDNGAVATFMGFEKLGDRQMFRLKQGGTGSRLWPMRDLSRLTPANQDRVPRGRIVYDQANNEAPLSALEQLFYLQAPAQVTGLKKRIIVVTPVGEAHQYAHEITLQGQKLPEILPMGHLRSDNEIEPWSSRFAEGEPLVTFVSDIDKACELVEDANDLFLVLVDGSVGRKSATFTRMSSCGAPTLVLVPESDTDALDFLARQRCRFWEWDERDVSQLFWPSRNDPARTGPLANYESRLQRARRESPVIRRLACEPADTAFEAITAFERLTEARGDEDLEELDQILANSYGLLLTLLQQVSTLAAEQQSAIRSRLDQLRQLRTRSLFMSEEERSAAATVEESLRALLSTLTQHNPKQELLEQVLTEYPDAALICRNAASRDRLTAQFGTNGRLVLSPAEGDKDLAGGAVVIGWFDRQRMSKLLLPPVASPLVILLYDIEHRWYEGLMRRQERQKAKRAAFGRRASVFSGFKETPTQPKPETELHEPEEQSVLSTLDTFERRAVEARRRRLLDQARTTGAEPEVEATLVLFSDGSHAFLTDTYQAKVVTHLLTPSQRTDQRAEVRLNDVEHLRTGDVLIFLRGSDRDVLRDVADRILPAGTRATATLWQRALRRFKQSRGLDTTAVWQSLRKAGCTHHKSTVKYWIESDEIIAPRDAHDHELRIIAEVTGDPELSRRLDECDRAVSAVWGAHLSASCRLAEQVLARTAQRLVGGVRMEGLVEIEPNVVLARVDEVQDEPVKVRRGVVNRLLEGDSWRG